MRVEKGEEGLGFSWQERFPANTECIFCGEDARIAFVAHEGMEEEEKEVRPLSSLWDNDPGGTGYWVHNNCAVAVYLCRQCLGPTALLNQA